MTKKWLENCAVYGVIGVLVPVYQQGVFCAAWAQSIPKDSNDGEAVKYTLMASAYLLWRFLNVWCCIGVIDRNKNDWRGQLLQDALFQSLVVWTIIGLFIQLCIGPSLKELFQEMATGDSWSICGAVICLAGAMIAAFFEIVVLPATDLLNGGLLIAALVGTIFHLKRKWSGQ